MRNISIAAALMSAWFAMPSLVLAQGSGGGGGGGSGSAAAVLPRQGAWGALEPRDQLRRQVQVSDGHSGRRRRPDQLDKSPAQTTWRVNQELPNRHRAPQGQRQALPHAVHQGWRPATATLPHRRQEPDRLGPPELLMVSHQGCKAPTRIIPQPSQEQLKAAPVLDSTELQL